VTDAVVGLPAASVAVTVNVCEPTVVSIGALLATVPAHPFVGAMPEPPVPSAQPNDAFTVAPGWYVAPAAGVVMVTVGACRSILNENGPTVTQLPSLSHRFLVPVSADADCVGSELRSRSDDSEHGDRQGRC